MVIEIRGDKGIAVNSIKIEVKPFEESMNETINVIRRIEKGEKIRLKKIVFNNVETLRSILTTERVRVLHCIKEKKPKSIYELAKMLDRNWRLVAKDVELLSNLGIVKLEKSEKPKEAIRPIVNFSKMNINVAI